MTVMPQLISPNHSKLNLSEGSQMGQQEEDASMLVSRQAFDNKELVNNDLIAACLSGDTLAQDKLYKMFAPRMSAVCKRFVKDSHLAQDVLQEGFIKVFHNLGSYSGAGSFEGWLRRIFIFTAIDYRRKALRNGYSEELTDWTQKSASTLIVPAEEGIKNLSFKDLKQLVTHLPPQAQLVFTLFIDGYSHLEISRMLDINEGTSKSQLARAKKLLQKACIKLYPHLETLVSHSATADSD